MSVRKQRGPLWWCCNKNTTLPTLRGERKKVLIHYRDLVSSSLLFNNNHITQSALLPRSHTPAPRQPYIRKLHPLHSLQSSSSNSSSAAAVLTNKVRLTFGAGPTDPLTEVWVKNFSHIPDRARGVAAATAAPAVHTSALYCGQSTPMMVKLRHYQKPSDQFDTADDLLVGAAPARDSVAKGTRSGLFTPFLRL